MLSPPLCGTDAGFALSNASLHARFRYLLAARIAHGQRHRQRWQHSRESVPPSLQVFMLSAEDHLDEEMLESIVNAEHTRVPVYEGERCASVCLHQKTTAELNGNERLLGGLSARSCRPCAV